MKHVRDLVAFASRTGCAAQAPGDDVVEGEDTLVASPPKVHRLRLGSRNLAPIEDCRAPSGGSVAPHRAPVSATNGSRMRGPSCRHVNIYYVCRQLAATPHRTSYRVRAKSRESAWYDITHLRDNGNTWSRIRFASQLTSDNYSPGKNLAARRFATSSRLRSRRIACQDANGVYFV